MLDRLRAIICELRHHAPFTLFGAATGIVAMVLFAKASPEVSRRLFQVFHPTHVVLSAIVTAALFKMHEPKRGFLAVLLVGYIGSIGVATLSDCVLPFFGETLLGVAVPTHAAHHAHGDDAHEDGAEPERTQNVGPTDENHAHDGHAAADHEDHSDHASGPRIHLGFIEDWHLVNPAAVLGVLIAWFWPRTRFPHAGHVLISTWASSFHVLMNTHREYSPAILIGMLLVLFLAVWLPCCISDIVVPLLFVRSPHLHVGHSRCGAAEAQA